MAASTARVIWLAARSCLRNAARFAQPGGEFDVVELGIGRARVAENVAHDPFETVDLL